MAENRQAINIGDLDFDSIKSNLREYLRGQTEFTDYDFEGSALNILLDILSVNTHYLGVYSNLVANEAFIDSAEKRSSVISIAKHLGYTPSSISAARAIVNINFGTTRPQIANADFDFLPTASRFTTVVDGTSYSFITTKPYELKINSENEYVIENVEIVEGFIANTSFLVDEQNANQRFVLPSNNIDTSTLVVRVQKSVTDSSGFLESWKKSTDFVSLGSDSRVYFLDEVENGRFQISFGDGILGRKPRNGNLITVQYLITDGPNANGIGRTDSELNRIFTLTSVPSAVISVTSASSGGNAAETIKSIKFNSVRNYQAQDRAVTANDYQGIISREIGDAESVFVYGGEDVSPPQFGKVFVAIKPAQGTELTTLEKESIANNVIGPRSILGITPEVVDPDFLFLRVTTNLTYDPSLTSNSDTQMETEIRNAIITYKNTSIGKFDQDLVYSRFVRAIDDTNAAILGNETTISLEKRIQVQGGILGTYEVDFNNDLLHPEDGFRPILSSSSFTYIDGDTTAMAFFDDDGNGNVRIYKLVDSQRSYLETNIGTIDYTTGLINIINFAPSGSTNELSTIKLIVEPAGQDVSAKRNTVIDIDTTEIDTISVTAAPRSRITDIDSSSGQPFPFSVTNNS